MRISDWSSDVCSSDLLDQHLRQLVEEDLGEGLPPLFAVKAGRKGSRESLNADGDLLVAQRRLMIQGDEHTRQQAVLEAGGAASDADQPLRRRADRGGAAVVRQRAPDPALQLDRKSTRLNSSH